MIALVMFFAIACQVPGGSGGNGGEGSGEQGGSGEGGETPDDPGEGGETPDNPGEGGETPDDPGQGGETPDDPVVPDEPDDPIPSVELDDYGDYGYVFPDTPTSDAAITFDTQPGNDFNISMGASAGTYQIIKDASISDRDDFVLHLHKTSNTNGTEFYLYPREANPDANVAVFEADILIKNVESFSQIEIGLSNSSSGGMKSFLYLISVGVTGTADGSELTYTDYSNGKSNTQYVRMGAKIGQWFKLRIEMWEGNKDTFYYTTYVNELPVYTSSAIYSPDIVSGNTNIYQAENIAKFSFRFNQACVGDFFIDNAYLEQKTESTAGDGEGDEGDEGDEGILIESDSNVYIVAENVRGGMGDVSKFINALRKEIVKYGSVTVSPERTHNLTEIIIGYVPSRSISLKAYELLESIPKPEGIRKVRYLIYVENGKIAVAFDENIYTNAQATYKALSEFVNNYMQNADKISLDNGIISSGYANVYERQTVLDELDAKERWDAIRDKLDDDRIYSALKEFYETIYSDQIISLLGTFYDPATGMFYASGSGKRANEIYPIPEATAQLLGYIQGVGLFGSDTMKSTAVIPQIAKYKTIYYLKAIQEPDGEFYVAQLKKSAIDSNRLGRDRSRCASLVVNLGGAPTYDVGSTKGDGITADQYWASLVEAGLVTEEDKPIIYWAEKRNTPSVTASLFESTVVAVANAVNSTSVVAVSSVEQFKTHEAFIKWLLAKDPYNNPYSAISNTSSASGLISSWSKKIGAYTGENTVISYNGKTFPLNNGDTLDSILIDWLNSNINEAGLFGKMTNNYDSKGNPIYDGFFGGWGYQNSNGFFKGIGRYNMAYPKPREAAISLLKGINSDEPATSNVLVMYNVWSSLSSLISNIKKYYEGDDKDEILQMIQDELYKEVYDEYTGEFEPYVAVAIRKNMHKVLAFKKADGGYGHSTSSGTSSWQGGLPVGIGSDNLSDMDAITCTTNGLSSGINGLLGISNVPTHSQSDAFLFIESLLAQEYVVKEMPASMRPIPEIETFDKGVPHNVKTSSPKGNYVSVTEKDGRDVIQFDKTETGFSSLIYEGVGKIEENANVVVIGLDVLIENLTGRSGLEIYPVRDGSKVFLPYLGISGNADGSILTVVDHKSANSAVDSGIRVGKWASVQIRYYPEREEYDFYVNGKKIITGSYLRSGTDYPTLEEIDRVDICMATANVGDFYFDNIYIHYLCEK